MKTNQEIADDILAVLPDASPSEDLIERLSTALTATTEESRVFRWNILLLATMHIEESLKQHAQIDSEALKRVTANNLLHTAAFIVRSLKRRIGGEIEPARFALVAYAMANEIREVQWESTSEAQIIEGDDKDGSGGIRAQIHRDRLATVCGKIAALGNDDAIRVECVASTIRNCVSARLGDLAFELVSEERELAEARP